MSKRFGGKTLRRASKLVRNVRAGDVAERLKMDLPAGQASNAPPLGPSLGARGIQSGIFVKQFNEMSAHIKAGTPIPVLVTIKGDRSFKMSLSTPPTSHFIKLAAGLKKGSGAPGKIWVGEINLRHVYEIAKVKQSDTHLQLLPLEKICRCIIGSCRSMGIRVVN
ncbi:hypothetical protein LOD99_13013 [Oopsacas minuta]|uniref:Large ribosomal subunit protein uL11m n=1 Tax=Oopsacas minuta TaxID=111878 RepID=A0AAV7JAL7_9METZ|nr:hypothetical protein LOD99_13013 [Oopsacas minuta]